MNIQNIKTKLAALVLTLAIGAVPLAPVLAKENHRGIFKNNVKAEVRAEAWVNTKANIRAGEFCSFVNNNSDAWIQGMATNKAGKDAKWMHVKTDSAQKRAERDARLQRARTQSDERLTEHFAKLEAKADTTAKRNAVAEYKVTITAAIQNKRAAFDAAVRVHRQGVDAAIAAHSNDYNNAVNALKTRAQAAVNTAKTQCANGTADATVKANFNTSIKAATEQFKVDINGAGSLGAELKTLAKTQEEALKKANEDYRTISKAAHLKLKTAFKA